MPPEVTWQAASLAQVPSLWRASKGHEIVHVGVTTTVGGWDGQAGFFGIQAREVPDIAILERKLRVMTVKIKNL